MSAEIAQIVPESLAEAVGLQPGDCVLAINGSDALEDMLDYQFEVTDADTLELHVRHADGTEEIYELEKEPDEDPGLIFKSPLFTPIRTCNNACPFCFIDQQPPGLRPSLAIKDDDYRLSYFNNTYITLTNLTARDRERITRLRPGPLYVSVHSTVPEIRRQLLKNPKAGNILDELRWLKSLDIPFHCQLVICPGINDGEALSQTLGDLATLMPEALSVAVVPVGLTQYREALSPLQAFHAESAKAVIERVDAFKAGHPDTKEFIFLSDEFYLKAGLPLPAYDDYADFPQLEDGVGTARMLLSGFYELEADLPEKLPCPTRVFLLTGRLGAMILQPIVQRPNVIQGLYVDMLTVQNSFWGDAVDVAGLIMGQDILATLKDIDRTCYHAVLIPSVMLKKDDADQFLDDARVSDLAHTLDIPFLVIDDPYSAEELVDTLLSFQPEALPA